MKSPFFIFIPILLATGSATGAAGPEAAIIAIERESMDAWMRGDPDRATRSLDPEVTYFHVMTEKRLDGLPAVKKLFEGYRGVALFDSYEMLDPKVQTSGDTAILTYILLRRIGNTTSRWNATQVYTRKKEGWRVIHTHWSATNPPRP